MVLDRITPAAYDYAFYPSDLYYADVARRDGSFDDWNARKDGFHASYFGEVRGEKNKNDAINFDRIDYRAELAVGRWPVDSVAEVELLAEKTMAQDRANLAAKGKVRANRGIRVCARLGRCPQADGPMDPGASEGMEELEALRRRSEGSRPTKRHVAGLLNEGASLVFHVGHGEDNGWVHSIQCRHVARLQNADRLPVVLSAGCSTARFATLPPYEPYEDVHGGSTRGRTPARFFRHRHRRRHLMLVGTYNNTGWATHGAAREERSRCLYRLQHGRAAVWTDVARGVRPDVARPA